MSDTKIIIMTFAEIVKEYLAVYKKTYFPYIKDGSWRDNEYPHIFPEKYKNNNILSLFRKDFFLSDLYIDKNSKKLIKLHKGFSHLNSSQAMCINFFYPLYKEKRLDLVLEYLNIKGEEVDYTTVRFEKESEVDNTSRGATNFDFYFKCNSGRKIYFEIKYTESTFGSAKKDPEHIEKFNKVYSDKLQNIQVEKQNVNDFLDNYQIMRNLIHIGNNPKRNCDAENTNNKEIDNHVVFLIPYSNIKLREEAMYAKDNIVEKKSAEYLHLVFWHEIFNFVYTQIVGEDLILKSCMDEFRTKYLM